MQRRFSITMYNLDDEAEEFTSSHRDDDDDGDCFAVDVVPTTSGTNSTRSNGRPKSCILIQRPTSSRVLDMELPSPPLRMKKSIKPDTSSSGKPSSSSSTTTPIEMPSRREDLSVEEKKPTPSSKSKSKLPRPSSSGWNLLGSKPRALTRTHSVKPRSECASLPFGLPDLPFGDPDEELEHHQLRSSCRRNCVTMFNLNGGLDDDIEHDEDLAHQECFGGKNIVQNQQSRSARNDRSSTYDRNLKTRTEASRQSKSQREDRTVNDARSDHRPLRRSTKKKVSPPTPPLKQHDAGDYIDDEPCQKPVATRRLLTSTNPTIDRPSSFATLSPPSSEKVVVENQPSSNYNHRQQSRRQAMNTSCRAEFFSPSTLSISYVSLPSLPPPPPLSTSHKTQENHDIDCADGKAYARLFKDSFHKQRMSLERSKSTRSIRSRAA
jgi:hypothetical protein